MLRNQKFIQQPPKFIFYALAFLWTSGRCQDGSYKNQDY